MKRILIMVIGFFVIVNLFSKDIDRRGFIFWLPDDIISESTDYTDNERWIRDSNKDQDFVVIHLPMTKYTDEGYVSLNAAQSLVYLLENGFGNYFQDFVLSEVKNVRENSSYKMKFSGNATYYRDSTVGDVSEPVSVNISGIFLQTDDGEVNTFGVLVISDSKKAKKYKKIANKILKSLK